MQDFLFYILSALAVVSAILVVANPLSRNPVTSAMFLVTSILASAGLFVLLQAYFLAAIQVLVYAGAVIVLFLFVIMLLNLPEEERRKLNYMGLAVAAVAAGSIFMTLRKAILASNLGEGLSVVEPASDSIHQLGRLLFQKYLLPFEVMSVLLLVGMIGVILLSKRDLK